MKRTAVTIALLTCVLCVSTLEARSTGANILNMVAGGLLLVGGGITTWACPLAGIPLSAMGAVTIGEAYHDEVIKKKGSIAEDDDYKGIGEEELLDSSQLQFGEDFWQKEYERRMRESQGLSPVPTFLENLRNLFGFKRAEAGELMPNNASNNGQLEPLQSIEDFLAEHSGRKNVTPEEKARRRDELKARRQAKQYVVQQAGIPNESPKSKATQPALSSLDLEDESYDWCTCNPPQGCFEAEMCVSFTCTKCKRVNREYAKKALQLERRMKELGAEVHWIGEGAEAKARRVEDSGL